MKKLLLVIGLLLFIACNGSIELVSAKKQQVIPGIRSATNYSNYIVKFKSSSDEIVEIQKVIISENGTCYKVNYVLNKKGSNEQLKSIAEKGEFVIIASMLETNKTIVDKKCNATINRLELYYSVNGKSKTLSVSKFTSEKINRR